MLSCGRRQVTCVVCVSVWVRCMAVISTASVDKNVSSRQVISATEFFAALSTLHLLWKPRPFTAKSTVSEYSAACKPGQRLESACVLGMCCPVTSNEGPMSDVKR